MKFEAALVYHFSHFFFLFYEKKSTLAVLGFFGDGFVTAFRAAEICNGPIQRCSPGWPLYGCRVSEALIYKCLQNGHGLVAKPTSELLQKTASQP